MTSCDAWPATWPCDTNGIAPERLEMATSLATSLLSAMTGNRFGVCTYIDQYRPHCAGPCVMPTRGGVANAWRNTNVANCCRILLDHRPVVEIIEVVEFDRTVPADGYRVEAGWLRRRGGCWSCSGFCDDPPVTVTYRAGVGLPAGTAAAVGEVACEFLAALDGSPCKLPGRAVSITRQGVTVDLGSADDFVKAGRLGLPIADAWLTAAGTDLKARSKVYSPDIPRAIR